MKSSKLLLIQLLSSRETSYDIYFEFNIADGIIYITKNEVVNDNDIKTYSKTILRFKTNDFNKIYANMNDIIDEAIDAINNKGDTSISTCIDSSITFKIINEDKYRAIMFMDDSSKIVVDLNDKDIDYKQFLMNLKVNLANVEKELTNIASISNECKLKNVDGFNAFFANCIYYDNYEGKLNIKYKKGYGLYFNVYDKTTDNFICHFIMYEHGEKEKILGSISNMRAIIYGLLNFKEHNRCKMDIYIDNIYTVTISFDTTLIDKPFMEIDSTNNDNQPVRIYCSTYDFMRNLLKRLDGILVDVEEYISH